MGGFTEEHFVDDYSEGVDVGFVGVAVELYGLRGHVEGSAHVHAVFESETGFYCKTEVRDLPFVAYSENVGWLEVAVDNSFADEITIPQKDLFKNFNRISLSEYFFLCNIFIKIPMRTIF